MSWKPIDGRIVTIEQFRPIIAALPFTPFRPSGGALHNTATPNLKRIQQFSIEHWRDMWVGYYKSQGWSGGPHAFVFPDRRILLFTPFNQSGVHSPSWNGTKFGVEMCADFAIDDDDAGLGMAVKQTAVAVFGEVYKRLGLDPDNIKLHKEDQRTTHDCPGRDIDKAEFIQLVHEYMGEAGEHPGTVAPPPQPSGRRATVTGIAADDTLNLRALSSASSAVIDALKNGTRLGVFGEATNGNTKWLRVVVSETGKDGWVNAHYVN
jgi:hypothetical protein